jgi:hypothetical protein
MQYQYRARRPGTMTNSLAYLTSPKPIHYDPALRSMRPTASLEHKAVLGEADLHCCVQLG